MEVNDIFILFLGFVEGLIVGVLGVFIHLINEGEKDEEQLEEIRRKRKENQNTY